MSKYNAKPVNIGGTRFASTGEYRRYCELVLMEKVGAISDLKLQPQFVLQEKFKRGKATVPAVKYIADFQYMENGRIVVEDFKGVKTAVFRMKQKLFWKRYPDLELRITR